MNGSILLDTSVIIELFAGEEDVVQLFQRAESVFVPSIAIGELFYGARKSSRIEENLAQIERFASANVVLACDADTARWYGSVKDQLRRAGKLIPENDIWI